MTDRDRINASVLEGDFQKDVVEAAETLGFLCYHTYRSDRSQAGFPDLVMVKPPRVIFAELKRQKGKPKPAQEMWLAALGQCMYEGKAIEVYLWRPGDMDALLEILQRQED
jgi:hypothetical protein